MANTKVPDLTGISSAATGDLLYIVDVSDTTDSAAGSSRKITIGSLASNTETLTNKTITTAGNTLDSASTTGAGVIEVATAAETTTGTDATRAVSPDGLAGSSIFGRKAIALMWDAPGTSSTAGTKKVHFHVPPSMNGMDLVYVHAELATAGTTGTEVYDINKNGTTMLSTKLSIDSGETGSDTAATAAVIDTTADDVATNDVISVDVDSIHSGTAGKGAVVTLEFQLP